MASEVDYVWTRREGEPSRAFEAFGAYLRLGPGRTLRKAVEADGARTTVSVFEDWSSRHKWVSRCEAYDRFIARAETDGLVSQIATVRERHIEVADKLINHLDSRLDEYIAKRQDPSMRWITAFQVAAKVQTGAFALRDVDRSTELQEQALELLKRLDNLSVTGPADA